MSYKIGSSVFTQTYAHRASYTRRWQLRSETLSSCHTSAMYDWKSSFKLSYASLIFFFVNPLLHKYLCQLDCDLSPLLHKYLCQLDCDLCPLLHKFLCQLDCDLSQLNARKAHMLVNPLSAQPMQVAQSQRNSLFSCLNTSLAYN